MRPFQHVRDAAAWIAKAPPFPVSQAVAADMKAMGNVIRFPIERRVASR